LVYNYILLLVRNQFCTNDFLPGYVKVVMIAGEMSDFRCVWHGIKLKKLGFRVKLF